MPFVLAIGDVVQVTSFCRVNQQAGLNVYRYIVTNLVGTTTTDLQVAQTWDGRSGGLLAACLSSSAAYQGAEARVLFKVDPPIPQFAEDLTVGTGGPNVLPTQVCGLVSWRSDFTGRRARGRSYIPFPATNFTGAGGEPTAGYLGRVEAYAASVQPPLVVLGGMGDSATLTLHVSHKVGITPLYPITSHLVRQGWATQRRRGDFGRTNLP